MYFLKLLRFSKAANILLRRCSGLASKEYAATPRGILNVVLPFRVIIKPLNVVDHPYSNKVIINCPETIICSSVTDSINITSNVKEFKPDITCEIYAPVESSINASCSGNVTMGNFFGEAVRVYSELGDIVLGNCKGDILTATTKAGDILTNGTVDTAKVCLKSLNSGNIIANKMKCLGLNIQTNKGNINLESSYSDESYFVTETGNLTLKNVHRLSKITINKGGNLNMIGFNGILDVKMGNGKANLQISELRDKSYISVAEHGQLVLQLSDSVLENTEVQVLSKCCCVEDDIVYQENDEEDIVRIIPKIAGQISKLTVKAQDAIVTVKPGSWKDMIEKSFKEAENV